MKLEAATTAYMKNVEGTQKAMKELFSNRYNQMNPYLRDLIILLEEFYERADSKIKPVANPDQLFLNDSVNTLGSNSVKNNK